MLLCQTLAFILHGKNMNSSYNKFKTSAPAFELPDGKYYRSDVQDSFEYIIKKHKTLIGNPSIEICIDKIENRIPFKIKTGYYIELLTTKIVTLLRSIKDN